MIQKDKTSSVKFDVHGNYTFLLHDKIIKSDQTKQVHVGSLTVVPVIETQARDTLQTNIPQDQTALMPLLHQVDRPSH